MISERQSSYLIKDESESQRERLTQIFNTALIGSLSSTISESGSDPTNELCLLMEQPAFRAILQSIHGLALDQSTSEAQAAQDVIRAFRKLDRIWTDYLIQEGIERLKSPSA